MVEMDNETKKTNCTNIMSNENTTAEQTRHDDRMSRGNGVISISAQLPQIVPYSLKNQYYHQDCKSLHC